MPRPHSREHPVGSTAIACLCLIAASAAALVSTTGQAARPRPARAPSAPVAGAEIHNAARTARAFLTEYLEWTTGRRPPSRITGASSELRKELVAQRLRPSRGTRRGRPNLTELRTDLTSPTTGRTVARVSDRVLEATYAVELTLTRGPAGWEVTDVHA